MAGFEPSYPVIATLTSENGIFMVCEPKGSTSDLALKRDELEKKLSLHVLQNVCDTEYNIEDHEPSIHEDELVAVSVSHVRKWHRGRIQKICGEFCEVILVDWGVNANVMRKDIQALPQKFRTLPYFSQEAILEGIRPVTNVIDYSSPSGPVLKKNPAEEYDIGALNFIEDMLSGSLETRMSVKGNYGGYLRIRLFVKQDESSSFCCLNDELCKEEYAEYVSKESVTLFEEESKPPQHLFDHAEINLPLVAFSDYAKNHAKVKKELEAQMLYSPKGAETQYPVHSSGMRCSSSFSNQSAHNLAEHRGRGKLLANDQSSATGSVVGTSYDSFSSDTSGNPKSIGRGRMFYDSHLKNVSKGTQEKAIDFERSSLPLTENDSRTGKCISHSKSRNEPSTLNPQIDPNPNSGDISSTQMAKTPDLPFVFPAGMPVNSTLQQSRQPRRNPPCPIVRPMFAPRIPVSRHSSEAFNLLNALRAVTSEKPRQNTLDMNTSATATLRSEILNPTVLRHQDPNNRQAVQSLPTEKQIPPVTQNVAKSPNSEATKNISVTQTACTSPNSKIDEDLLRDTMELLALVPGKSSGISQPKGGPQLKLSRCVEMLKEGRVLVRCPGNFTPTCYLNDIPFETPILEALARIGIRQPKTIQSYVWSTLLSLTNVAYVAGSKAGKTLGYLVPILNNLLDEDVYRNVPSGGSPLAIVICPTWRSAETVHSYCCQLTTKLSSLRTCVLFERSPEAIKAAIPLLINGVSLLAVTAPAFLALLEESQEIINLNRCCHLIFEDADVLLKNHLGAVRDILVQYNASVQRSRSNPATCHMTRQVVICAQEWSKGLGFFINDLFGNPWLFISSCLEAAVYGQMKFHLLRGTKDEMKAFLFQTVVEKKQQKRKMIIFCRDSEEIQEVGILLRALSINPLCAHGQSMLSDFTQVTHQWKTASSGTAVLLCTDDVLARLDIRDAEILIHYFIPPQSKFNFTYRLSFAIDNFRPEVEDFPRPESYLLFTEEFKNSLRSILRIVGRCGYPIPEDLSTEAVVTYCDKQTDTKDFPLCSYMKAFGECPEMNYCDKRHVIHAKLDQCSLPFRNGLVRIKITAVQSATQYYARVLKYAGEDRKMIDVTAPGLKLEDDIRKHFCREGASIDTVPASMITVGEVYARKIMEGLYQRVRIVTIAEKDVMGVPLVVKVFSLDLGDISPCRNNDLFLLPEELKKVAPQAVEIILVGLRPLDKDYSWHDHCTNFVRERISGRELDGRIVLALSSTLWLNPLHERKKVSGTNAMVVVTDIYKELLDARRAEKNDDHMEKLYQFCKIGQVSLLDYSIGIAPKKRAEEPEICFAFFPLFQEVEVKVICFLSPELFYVTRTDYQRLVQELESDILREIGKCNAVMSEEAIPGKLCLANSLDKSGVWCRSCIKRQISNASQYEIVYVDYGLTRNVQLEDLKDLPKKFVERLPFQAISCSLNGVKPLNGTWTNDAIEFINACLYATVDSPPNVCLKALSKSQAPDPVTKSANYSVKLTIRQDKEAPAQDLKTLLVANNHALSTAEEIAHSNTCEVSDTANELKIAKPQEKIEQSQHFDECETEDSVFVHPSWFEEFLQGTKSCSVEGSKKDSSNREIDEASSIPTGCKSPQDHRDKSSKELIDHTAPQKSGDSSFPTTKWYQTNEEVIITLEVREVISYEVDYSPSSLHFVATGNPQRYELRTNTYGAIIPERSSHKKTSAGIVLKLQKRNAGEEWIRLIQSPHRPDWLRRDFSHISEFLSSSEEDEGRAPLVDPKYVFEEYQDSTDASSDYDVPDERDFDDE